MAPTELGVDVRLTYREKTKVWLAPATSKDTPRALAGALPAIRASGRKPVFAFDFLLFFFFWSNVLVVLCIGLVVPGVHFTMRRCIRLLHRFSSLSVGVDERKCEGWRCTISLWCHTVFSFLAQAYVLFSQWFQSSRA